MSIENTKRIWVYFQGGIFQARIVVSDAMIPALLESLHSLAPKALQSSLSYPPNDYELFTFQEPIQISSNIEEVIQRCRSDNRIAADGNLPLRAFGNEYSSAYVYFTIQTPDDPLRIRMQDLETIHPELSKCLTVYVMKLNAWEQADVIRNGGRWVTATTEQHIQANLATITELLEKKRWYEPDNCKELELARGFEDTFDECYVDRRSSQLGGSEQHFAVTDPSEFHAFYHIGNHLPKFVQSYAGLDVSSSVKASSFTTYFTHTPCLSVREARKKLLYRENTSWGFPILVGQNSERLDSLQEYDGQMRRFVPKSDFDLIHNATGAKFPLIIGEVVSDERETDRWRMLVEAIVAARVGKFLTKAESKLPFFVTAIYLTKGLEAELYILIPTETTVYIHYQTRDLQDRREAQLFLRDMFNLTSIAAMLEDQLDVKKFLDLVCVWSFTDGLAALTTGTRNSDEGKRNASGTTPHGREDEPMEEDDDISVFERSEIRSAIRKFDMRIIHTERPDIAMLFNLDGSKHVGYLKFIPAGEDELEILRYLAAFDDGKNHTIRPIRWWPTEGGTVLCTPNAGGRLTRLPDPGSHLQSVARQLFEGVAFMHLKGVAHLDLKPDNIIIPRVGGRLVIIDFSVSVRVSGIDDMFDDEVGTDGYMAPEVGMKPYSAIRADLWSCGKAMQEFCLKCPESHFRHWLLNVCHQLMHEGPDERPTMDQVLDWLSDYHVAKSEITDKAAPP